MCALVGGGAGVIQGAGWSERAQRQALLRCEAAGLASERVGEGDCVGEELERFVVVVRPVIE